MSDAPRAVPNVPLPPAIRGPEQRRPELGDTPSAVTTALDFVSEGFILLDREWRFVHANRAAEGLMRRARTDVLGKSFWECFPEAHDRRFGIEYRRAVAESIPVQFEAFYPQPLNAWFEVRAYPSPEGLSIFFRDVTARRAAAEALLQSEQRYRALFENMSEGFALHEIVCRDGVPCDYRFLDINPAFENLTGLKRDDVVGRLVSEVLPGEDPHWISMFGAVAQTGESVSFDHSSRVLNRHYQVFAYRLAPGQFAVLFHDITEHRRLEEALRVNLTKYSVLFDSFPLGISVTDAAGQVREINRRASLLLGATPGEIVGQHVGTPVWQIIRPDGSIMPPDEFASVRAMRERRVVEDVEAGIARPGEEVIWVSVTAAPIPLEGYGVVITYGDVSRRKLAEARLADAHRKEVAAKARLEAAMEALPIGLAVVDNAGGTEMANAGFERLWGPGRPPTSSIADYPKYKARWLESGRDVLPGEWASVLAITNREPVVGQLLEIERFDGGHACVLNSAAPILDEAGGTAGCVVAIQDVTRLVEAERSLEQSREALRVANASLADSNARLLRSNESLEVRVADRTHDLIRRTAQLQALAVDITRAEERERQRVAEVIHDHLQQVLAVARINLSMALGRVRTAVVRKSLIDLDELLAQSLDITRSLTAELSPSILRRGGLAAALRWLGRWYQGRFGLQVAVEIDAEVEPDDDTRVVLFRAVRELLFNVVKHARVAEARVRLSRTADGRACIVVSDEGAGFDPESLRGGGGDADSLGLFSLRERMDVLGGHFEVDSSPGRGTSITIWGPPPGPMGTGTPAARPAGPLQIAVRRRKGERSGRPPCHREP